jgi:hypothetical protein
MAAPSPDEPLGELWIAAAGDSRPPDLPDDACEALVALLAAMSDLDGGEVFLPIDLDAEPDPYAAIAVGAAPALPELVAGVRVTGLWPFASPSLQDVTFYLDPIRDAAGNYRVYVRDEEALPGVPHELWFTSTEDAARWMAAFLRDEADWDRSAEPDEWERGPTSGSWVLESLLESSLPFLWRAVADGMWPEGAGAPFPDGPDPGEPGWERALCARLLHDLVETRELEIPAGVDVSKLPAPHRAFIAHLENLAQAVRGEIPDVITELLAADGPLADKAAAWIARFEAAGADGDAFEADHEVTAVNPPEHDSFEHRLKVAVGAALDELVRREVVEVSADDREDLVDELFLAAAEAENPQKMIKRMVHTLVDSDLVEEVYAGDDELGDALVAAFKS